ncbi:ABC transporter permease [Nocardioides sp. zg-ZUI104]|uniref:ABC transporter permease n=1 Tax=Nocardioides faecalis TaxID=2803858 RepID=UPI001BCC8A76|nr:ABC transporter permease [Nocardioides faecalis]MBS4751588.1 ABC transporter permease [Nocardioides faecalis]
MRGYRALTLALVKSQVREPVSVFFLLIFSPALLLTLGLIFGNEPSPELGGNGFVDNMLPGITVISTMIVGIVSVPQNQLVLRSTGAFTRLRVTPLRPRTYVAADLTVHFVLGMAGALLTLLLGITVLGVDAPQHVLGTVAAIAVGLVAMLAIGYTLAALYPSVGAATGIGNGLMIVLMMTSGALIPTQVLPEGIRTVMKFSPVHHVVELVDASWHAEAWPLASVAFLVATAAIFGTLGAVLFRWDRTS